MPANMHYIEFKNCSCNWIGHWRDRPKYCRLHGTDMKLHMKLPDDYWDTDSDPLGWCHA